MHKTFQFFNLSTALLGVLVTMIVVGMLMAFHSVVQGAVQNGELRRQTVITQADVIWRCKMLSDLPARNRCLLQADVVALATP